MNTRESLGPTTTVRELEYEAAVAARFDIRILLTGDSGVGKQTLARLIHERSRGAVAPFVVVDCSRVSDSAFESQCLELLTNIPRPHGSARDRGLETPQGGTIFVRSVEKMTARKQSALFRCIDTSAGGGRAPGGPSAPSNTRLIAAGCGSLLDAVEAGTFRNDLFYRLNTFHLHISPLRERPHDVPILLDRLLREAAETQKRRAPFVSTEALSRLMAYSWPGNVHELRSVVEEVMADGHAEVIDPRMLPPRILEETNGAGVRDGLGVNLQASDGPRPRAVARSR